MDHIYRLRVPKFKAVVFVDDHKPILELLGHSLKDYSLHGGDQRTRLSIVVYRKEGEASFDVFRDEFVVLMEDGALEIISSGLFNQKYERCDG